MTNGQDTWEKIKAKGSFHYKTIETEPIDLLKSGGLLWNFAISSIIKYAFRNRHYPGDNTLRDLDKIIHYAEMLRYVTTTTTIKQKGNENEER